MNENLNNIFRLDGKVIIVTGATGLLGRKHSEAIAAYGGTPILLDINASGLEKLELELNEKYDVKASGYVLDITDEKQVEENSKEILVKYGHIDGLVNNAANNPKVESDSKINFSRLENFPLETWSQDLAVGLTGAFLCAKHYGPVIAKSKDGGSIVNISSDLGLIAPDQRLYENPSNSEGDNSVKPDTYSVVKTGLIGLTRYLATYWIKDGVRCNAMCPGGVENGQPDVFLEKVFLKIPMNRLARVDEYQGTLIWMLSNASSYLNGAIIPVEGGRTCW